MVFIIPVYERNGVLPDVSAECLGPRLTFQGRALSSIHKEQRRGPRPHCLSNNWDVKPFTESSGKVLNEGIESGNKRDGKEKNGEHEGK